MIATISEDCVALCEIEAELQRLEAQRKRIEFQIAAMQMVKTCLLTDINQVSNVYRGRHYA